MPRQSGACVPCRQITFWRTKGRLTGLQPCRTCGGRLVAPGTREYMLIAFDWDAARALNHIAAYSAKPTPWLLQRSPLRGPADESARIARDLAHLARQLYPHLRFDFDTDATGQVIDDPIERLEVVR